MNILSEMINKIDIVNRRDISYRIINSYSTTLLIFCLLISVTLTNFLLKIDYGCQQYPLLLVGACTWNNAIKFVDFIAISGLIVVFFTMFLFTVTVLKKIEINYGIDLVEKIMESIRYSIIPAAIWLGSLIFRTSTDMSMVYLSGLMGLIILYFCVLFLVNNNTQKNDNVAVELIYKYYAGLAMLLFLYVFSVFGIVEVLFKGSFFSIENILVWMYQSVVVGFIFLLLLIALINYKRFLDIGFVNKILFVIQIPTAMLFFSLIPLPWYEDGTRFYGYEIKQALYIFIFILMMINWGELIYKYKYKKNSVLVSLVTLVGVLFVIKYPIVALPVIYTDDYHVGEFLLPWVSHQSGQVPFWDYAPARGLINYLPGMVANLFFDGTAPAYLCADNIVKFIGLWIGFIGFSRIIGVFYAFLIFLIYPLANGIVEIQIVMVLAAVGLCYLIKKISYHYWIPAYFFIGVAMVLYAPGQGGIMILSLAPVAVYYLLKGLRGRSKAIIISIIATLCSFAVMLMALPDLYHMIYGAVRYVAEQGNVNSIAYGVPWILSFSMPNTLLNNQLLFEVIRCSWILVMLFFGVQSLKNLVKQDSANTASNVALITLFTMMVLYISQAAGRIDPNSLSRVGFASLWSICLALPIMLKNYYPSKYAQCIIITMLLGSVLTQGVYGIGERKGLFYESGVNEAVGVPTEASKGKNVAVDGNMYDMPNIGKASIDEAQLRRLVTIKKVLSAVLQDNETYLDLTNRNAHYFYLNYPSPIETGAFYNIPHDKQQLRAIENLGKKKPPVILIEADNILHDGGAASLRSHLLYRFSLQVDYTTVLYDGLVFLISSDRMDLFNQRLGKQDAMTVVPEYFSEEKYLAANPDLVAAGVNGTEHFLQTGQYEKRKISPESDPMIRAVKADDSVEMLRMVLAAKDLAKIPVAWGRSIDSLSREITFIKDISSENIIFYNDSKSILIDNINVSGSDAGLVLFDYMGSDVGVSIFGYDSSQKEILYTNAVFSKGKILLPLDIDPGWIKCDNIKSLKFKFEDLGGDELIEIKNLGLFQRNNVNAMKAILNSDK